MGRKAYFNSEEFIDSAIKIIAEEGLGALTIAGLATRVTAPVGSVYHRFPSRDALIAELWLNIIESFQSEWLKSFRRTGSRQCFSAWNGSAIIRTRPASCFYTESTI